MTHFFLRYLGFVTLQPVYPEETHGANAEKRGNGGVRMGGGGDRNPSAAPEKGRRGAAGCPSSDSEQGRSKSNNGKEAVL